MYENCMYDYLIWCWDRNEEERRRLALKRERQWPMAA